MKGAIIGDIVGSRFEWHNVHTKDFELFGQDSFFTDDTVMTCAVAKALLGGARDAQLTAALQAALLDFGRRYPDRGYGSRFVQWLQSDKPEPYRSWGNGAMMRCSPAGILASSLSEAEALGRATAAPTHNHPLAENAAALVAGMIFLARAGHSKADVLAYAAKKGYAPLTGAARAAYQFDESCAGTVPAVLTALEEGTDLEDTLRTAISLGGDSDTIAAIAGSVAEFLYGVPDALWGKASMYLNRELRALVRALYAPRA